MKKIVMILVAALLVTMVPAASWAIGVEGAVGMWKQTPSGQLQYEGDMLDIGEDLGVNDDELRMTARLKLDMPGPIPNVYLMATKMDFSGASTQDFTYGSYDYTLNTTTDLVLDHYDIALYYGVPFLSTLSADKLNLEAGLNIRMLDLSAKIEDTDNHMEEQSLTVAIPMIYAGLQIRPTDEFSFEFEGRGISYSGNNYYDAIARVKIKPMGPVFIAGGYRYESIKVDEDDIFVDMVFEGPFVEAGFEF
ncbi:MAG: TIGR04219 family outer membrane beta-barrel protein [Thermodesulfovibrionales bacterium]|nr:TIGR04219 family outer membrane beta-barrel protein [Thermodesulfovibrionales bacterium]